MAKTFNRISFTPDNRNLAQPAAKAVDGWVTVWGFAPFWIGDDIQDLQTAGSAPGGAFNLENRLGHYIIPANPAAGGAAFQPVTFPWKGDLWVLNGEAAGDQPFNVVIVQVVNQCATA